MEPQSGGTVSHEDELTALRQKLDSSVSPEVWSNTLRRAEDLQQRLEASEEENARVLGLLLDLRKAHSVQQGRMQAFLEGEVEAPLPHSPPPCHADADAATPMPCSPDAALESALRELAYRTEHQVEEVAFLEEARATERQEHSLDCHLQEGLFRKELLQAEEQVYNEARRAEAAELVARRLKAAAAQEAEAASAVQARLAAACSRKVERKRDRIADLEMQLLRLEGELLKAQQEGGAAPQPDSAAPTPPPADAAETADRRSSQLEERMVELALEVEAAAAMREAHDDLQDRVGELSAEANQYRTQLEDSQRALAELPLQADRLEEMEARAAGLAEENARAAERVAQLQEECASLQRDRDELRQQADGTQGQLDDSMRQVEGMAARIAEAERDHLSETARLRGDLQGVQADAERLRGESGAALQAAEERRAEGGAGACGAREGGHVAGGDGGANRRRRGGGWSSVWRRRRRLQRLWRRPCVPRLRRRRWRRRVRWRRWRRTSLRWGAPWRSCRRSWIVCGRSRRPPRRRSWRRCVPSWAPRARRGRGCGRSWRRPVRLSHARRPQLPPPRRTGLPWSM